MSNYTKTTDFEAKDSLPSGDSGKIIRGSEFETEFDNIATAIATKADAADILSLQGQYGARKGFQMGKDMGYSRFHDNDENKPSNPLG